jgi:glycosyltransferase involved in cell wall biosynthesis
MSPVVSVLLPYRNAEETLEEAVTSVLQEHSIELEIIAADDGSTDGGPAIIDRIRRADPRVVPASTSSSGGIARALNHALSLARGPFIARMDADDISLPGRLPRQVAALAQDPRLGVIGTQVEAFPEGSVGEGMQRYIAWQNALVTPEDHAREIFVEAPLCHPSVMIRRAALDAVGGFREGPWPEDYDLWLRLDARGYALAKVPEVLFRWRQRKASATFSDPRYSLARFTETRAYYLAPRLLARGRPIAVWGAGKTGRRLARQIAAHGARPELFIDIDPRKIGRTAQGAPIEAPDALVPGKNTIVVAVGARGARELIRAHLAGAGFREGMDFDFICAA